MEVVNFIQDNAFWILLVFTALEKIVKKSPAKWDDILFDMIVDPLRCSLKKRSK
jgi:hypothetical protein